MTKTATPAEPKFHGPRAFIVAGAGRTLLAFDADGLHYRIAAMYSRDPFINEALQKYDSTKDPTWKPHVRNCAAIFGISPQEAVVFMEKESPKYTFAKNSVYLWLNGGDVPALANAAASAGLDFDLDAIGMLLDNWVQKAKRLHDWRLGLLDEVSRTGMVVLPSGRRRRFYNLTLDKATGRWKLNHKVTKEIYNHPLLGTEVDYMTPRFVKVLAWTEENPQWLLCYHGHDGMMLDGPESEAKDARDEVFKLVRPATDLGGGFTLNVPWDAKVGPVWAGMKKFKET